MSCNIKMWKHSIDELKIFDRIPNENLSWKSNLAKFCQLIASLSIFLPLIHLILQNSHLSTWSLALSAKKKDKNTGEKCLYYMHG